MRNIHPTAIVHPRADLGEDVEVGAYSIINEDTQIGRGTVIGPHVQIDRWTVIGKECRIFFGSTIGNPSKDLKYGGWRSFVRVGDRNTIREHVSISRATTEEGATVVGDGNLLMNYVNIAHDAHIGNRVILTNLATVGGHVIIEDDARIGAQSAFHPFVRVGKKAMAGACSKFVQDVPPFSVSDGHPARVRGLNLIGLRTSKIHPMASLSAETINRLKRAFRLLFRSELKMKDAIAQVRQTVEPDAEVEYLLRFVETSTRGIGYRRSDADDDD